MSFRLLATVAAVLLAGAAGRADVGKWDPAMAANGAVVDTKGVKWIDGKLLPLEGRAFDDTASYYERLPANVTERVNEGVRRFKTHTSGMLFRFKTDSPFVIVRWKVTETARHMRHMTDVGVSGWDVYRREAKGGWRYVTSSHLASPTDVSGEFMKRVPWRGAAECLINLPLYNGVESISVGIDPQAKILPARPHAGATKPVVFYGTSITQGACASRPGLAFVNRVGRDLDVPVVGLGFSGSGVMEMEMCEHVAKIDASCYVLDCLWNMGTRARPDKRPGRNVEDNYEPFVRALRAKRPDVPIVMAEACDVYGGRAKEKDRLLKALYDKLVAEGWKQLVYLSKEKMYAPDGEGSMEGVHPNDLGMQTLAEAYGGAVRKALSR